MIFRWTLMDVAQEWLGNFANLNEPAKSKQFINRCVLGACLDHQISGKKINWYLGWFKIWPTTRVEIRSAV